MRNGTFGFSYRRIFFLFSIWLIFSILPPVSSFSQSPPKLRVVSTLFPLQEFAKAVGGERAQVDLLLPPGAEPHTWEPKPSEVANIYRADIFIYNGPVMEPWVEGLLKGAKSSRLKTVEAGKGLSSLDFDLPPKRGAPSSSHGRSGKADPHFWLDFSLDEKVVEEIVSAFSGKDPAHASQYRANADGYKSRLEALDHRYSSSLARCRHRQIILGGHSAFAYLAKRYGLQQMALYGLSPNAEPTPKKLASVIQAAKQEGVKYIFFEGLVNPKLAQVLAEEASIGTLPLYDGANLTRDQLKKKLTFLRLMEMNLESLRQGLGCE